MAEPPKQLLTAVVSRLGLALSKQQLEQLATHFSLLLHWNRKINLTSVRRPEAIATRHFEESLFLVKLLRERNDPSFTTVPAREGLLVDIGSGAGFPGLPIKVAWPELRAVLLEPNQKKAAFLKEVIRHCGIEGIEVRRDRLEDVAQSDLAGQAALVTVRAVAPPSRLLEYLKALIAPGGRVALFIGLPDAARSAAFPAIQWEPPVALPHSERRALLLGQLPGSPR